MQLSDFLIYGQGNGLFGADFIPGATLGTNALAPGNEAMMAEAARAAAAQRLARSSQVGRDNMFWNPELYAPSAGASDLERMLMASAASGPPVAPAAPVADVPAASAVSPLSPPSFDGRVLRGAQDMPAPFTEASAVARPVGPPMQIAPDPMQAAPQAPSGPDFLGRFSNALADNSGLLMALGAGMMQGGLGKGLQMGVAGGQLDDKRKLTAQSQAAQQAVYAAVLRATGDRNKATLAASDPEARKFVLEQIYGAKKPAGTWKMGGAEIPYTLGPDGSPQFIVPGGTDAQSLPELIGYLQQLDADNERRKAAAQAAGKVQGEAGARLPNTLGAADEAIAVIDQIRNHPGRGQATEWLGTIPGVPGTKGRDFVALVDQAKGQVFLQAYQQLKGGGQITEIEGQKAEQAIARLDRAQSKEAFDKALDDLEAVIRKGRANAGVLAGGKPTPAAPSQGGWTTLAPGIRIREVK